MDFSQNGENRALTGEAHKRFVLTVCLLCLIDPVRGEPTVHSLDRHPHDSISRSEDLQKKFLDSFALICSTSSKGAETASAVCLEQGHPSGTILRVARNCGMPRELVESLQEILDELTRVASGGILCPKPLRSPLPDTILASTESAKEREYDILYKVVDLTRDKIRSILETVHKADIQKLVEKAIQDIKEGDFLDNVEGTNFRQWIRNLPILTSLQPDAEPSLLIPHIMWASKARWVYSEHLEALLCPEGQDLPSWLHNVYKLGRYFAATKSMLKLATKKPSLFAAIHVEVVEAPEQQNFSLKNDRTALRTVLQRLGKEDSQKRMSQLGKMWLTEDPELRFFKSCRQTLTVHAEMQLLSFYDHHPEFTPRLLFMGASKKACFLCHEFMSRHPLAMNVSASHQKLYPSWMPAPCSISAVRKQHKVMLWELTRHLEQTILRDLETRLGSVRRKPNLDSTAGPSLTTSGSVASEPWVTENLPQLNQDFDVTAAVERWRGDVFALSPQYKDRPSLFCQLTLIHMQLLIMERMVKVGVFKVFSKKEEDQFMNDQLDWLVDIEGARKEVGMFS